MNEYDETKRVIKQLVKTIMSIKTKSTEKTVKKYYSGK